MLARLRQQQIQLPVWRLEITITLLVDLDSQCNTTFTYISRTGLKDLIDTLSGYDFVIIDGPLSLRTTLTQALLASSCVIRTDRRPVLSG